MLNFIFRTDNGTDKLGKHTMILHTIMKEGTSVIEGGSLPTARITFTVVGNIKFIHLFINRSISIYYVYVYLLIYCCLWFIYNYEV